MMAVFFSVRHIRRHWRSSDVDFQNLRLNLVSTRSLNCKATAFLSDLSDDTLQLCKYAIFDPTFTHEF